MHFHKTPIIYIMTSRALRGVGSLIWSPASLQFKHQPASSYFSRGVGSACFPHLLRSRSCRPLDETWGVHSWCSTFALDENRFQAP